MSSNEVAAIFFYPIHTEVLTSDDLEYCRLRVGEEHDGVVRMVGVAVQQAPWLVVLEFVQFGDLRAVLQAYTENSEQLTTGEMIRTMRQLASACGYVH